MIMVYLKWMSHIKKHETQANGHCGVAILGMTDRIGLEDQWDPLYPPVIWNIPAYLWDYI